MGFVEIALLGVALSMDAATITIANTLAYGSSCGKRRWLMPLFFALFQGLMPMLGNLLGALFAGFISKYSSIVLFAIFAVLGGKMLWDYFHADGEDEAKCFSVGLIAVQALATSIDAFAVGVSFAATYTPALPASLLIAGVTFVICACAMLLGGQAAKFLKNRAALVGGVLLLCIAVFSLLK